MAMPEFWYESPPHARDEAASERGRVHPVSLLGIAVLVFALLVAALLIAR
jgi:hypothetical protein